MVFFVKLIKYSTIITILSYFMNHRVFRGLPVPGKDLENRCQLNRWKLMRVTTFLREMGHASCGLKQVVSPCSHFETLVLTYRY